jgi:hypothetical protein
MPPEKLTPITCGLAFRTVGNGNADASVTLTTDTWCWTFELSV